MRIPGPSDDPREPRAKPERGRGGFLQGLRRPPPPQRLEREIDWRAYDPVAEDYERVLGPRTALVADDLVALTGVQPGGRVLDVGSGTGVAARAAASVVGPDGLVVGLDVALGMLRVAKRVGGGPRYIQGAAIDLPFRANAFGHVIASFVLSHFVRYETALFDMLRVLRSGGRLGLCTWGPGADEFSRVWDGVAGDYTGRDMLKDAYRRALPWSDRFADPGNLKESLYDAGLRDVDVQRRTYRFEMSAEDYLVSREISATGRFLRQMLGDRLWDSFRQRSRAVFADRFPPHFNDFRDAYLATGTKPKR